MKCVEHGMSHQKSKKCRKMQSFHSSWTVFARSFCTQLVLQPQRPLPESNSYACNDLEFSSAYKESTFLWCWINTSFSVWCVCVCVWWMKMFVACSASNIMHFFRHEIQFIRIDIYEMEWKTIHQHDLMDGEICFFFTISWVWWRSANDLVQGLV